AVLAVEMPFQRHMPRRAPLKSPIQEINNDKEIILIFDCMLKYYAADTCFPDIQSREEISDDEYLEHKKLYPV
ncbi:MAG: hypothetical protein H7835_20965, partial [Magnetococcus sp. XQGC-1]